MSSSSSTAANLPMDSINQESMTSGDGSNVAVSEDLTDNSIESTHKYNGNQKRKYLQFEQEEDEEAKLAAKREYNRLNAAKNRKRQKELIASLQDQVKTTTDRMGDLERENEVLKVQVKSLREQNELLLMRNYQPTMEVAPPAPPAPTEQATHGSLQALLLLHQLQQHLNNK